MRYLAAVLALCLAQPVWANEAEQDAAFRQCVAETKDEGVSTSYHHCTGALVTSCGNEETAKAAVDCINTSRDRLKGKIAVATEVLSAETGEPVQEIEATLADTRASGESACALMARNDADAGVAVGQRAVNLAFCELVAEGDVYALLVVLEGTE